LPAQPSSLPVIFSLLFSPNGESAIDWLASQFSISIWCLSLSARLRWGEQRAAVLCSSFLPFIKVYQYIYFDFSVVITFAYTAAERQFVVVSEDRGRKSLDERLSNQTLRPYKFSWLYHLQRPKGLKCWEAVHPLNRFSVG
jgi:hypothetical protein